MTNLATASPERCTRCASRAAARRCPSLPLHRLSRVRMPPRPRRLSLPAPPACERSPHACAPRRLATPAMAAARTSTPSHRPSSPRPPPTPESACSRPNEAPGPGHHLHASPERRRSGTAPPPPATRRGAAATDRLLALQGHLQVRADLLSLLHPSLAAIEPSHGRNRRSPFTPPLFSRPGTPDSNRKNSRVFSAKSVTHMNSAAKGCFAIIG